MKYLLSFVLIIALSGCGADKYTLFQDNQSVSTKGFFIPNDTIVANATNVKDHKKSKKITYEYKIAPKDRLSILVYKHPELSTTSTTTTPDAERGMLVTSNGTINLPLIGDVKVVSLTAQEASRVLEAKFSKYVKIPHVTVEIINKRIYVLGEVKKPGMIPVDADFMSIVEVLSASGGLTTYAKRDEIQILRGDLNNPDITTIDMTNLSNLRVADLMIKPNDIIYIKPNSARAKNISIGEVTPAIGLFNSILSTFVNIKYISDN
jgi:polysaccharide export outer membrane protein